MHAGVVGVDVVGDEKKERVADKAQAVEKIQILVKVGVNPGLLNPYCLQRKCVPRPDSV